MNYLRLLVIASVITTIAMTNPFYGNAQTDSTKKSGSYLTLNTSLSGGHILLNTNGKTQEALSNLNIGWYGYLENFSTEIQFSFSPFIGSLTKPTELSWSKNNMTQVWFSYALINYDVIRFSPTIGFGGYNLYAGQSSDMSSIFANVGLSIERFFPNSPIMIGARAGYQHNFSFIVGSETASANQGGVYLQLRAGIRLF